MKVLVRLLLLPFGAIRNLIQISLDGSRDLNNGMRFMHSKIDKNCSLSDSTFIADNVHILENCIINNCTVSSYSYIGRNCMIQNANIGKFCSFANDVLIGLGTHPTHLFSTSPLFYRKINTFGIDLIETDYDFNEYSNIHIGNDVWIGARAIILDGVSIGDGAIIASNSVVTKDIPPYAIVAGVPGKVLKYRFSPEKIEKLHREQWWNWDIKRILEQSNRLNNL